LFDGNGDYVNPGDNTGVCYPFPYTGYDECNVQIQVYDLHGDELVPFLANSVAYWGEFTLDPIVLRDPGRYYIGITGDESIDSAPSFVPIPTTSWLRQRRASARSPGAAAAAAA